jgi:TonB family protein
MAWRLACVVAILAWQQAPAPAQSPPAAWPPAGVYQFRDVDVAPKLIHQVKPNYTGVAMRARIQGEVILSCVVLTDGSVGDVRVSKSLDATLGLDDEAIAAVKQWRFSPAMKAGSPVPVLVDINLSFTLRSGPPAAPTLTWPEGFEASLDDATKQAEWREDTFEVLNLRIKIAYPTGWTLTKSPNEREMLSLTKTGEVAMLGITPPQSAMISMDHPLPPEQLQRVADAMTRKVAEQGMKIESLGFGQAPAASHIWACHAFGMASLVTPNMPSIGGVLAAQLYDGGRVWEFEGTAGESGFTIFCIIGLPRSLSDTARTSFVTSHAAVFGEMLRRLSITAIP